ncbi:MAG: LacI family DNA-binding transcriptional regulator [Lapillicoccus sp.]
MRDVAALAGVSLKTVSRVVNCEPGVSDDLRERVERAVERLDYTHNLTASNLRRSHGRTGVVGALVQDVSNSFSVGLLRSLEDAARERQCVVLAASIDEETDRERALVADLVARRVDGLILMPSTRDQSYLASEVRAGLPTVFVDRPPRGIDSDSVLVDNRRGAREAVTHLISYGHTRVAALVDLTSIPTAAARLKGFEVAMKAAGLRPDPELVVTDLRTAEEAQEALVAMMARLDPPTAVFACRNILSIGAIRALRGLGVSQKVALVGFDDFPLADLMTPSLTVVRQDVREIGRLAAELLFSRIDGDTSPPRRILTVPTLVVRGSGEIAPPDPQRST